MEQYNKIVLVPPFGMHYTTSEGENGELIVELVQNPCAISSRHKELREDAREEAVDKAKYFTKITAEDRDKVRKWLAGQNLTDDSTKKKKWFGMRKSKQSSEAEFLNIVRIATEKIDYDFWIATIEPHVDTGMIIYEYDKTPNTSFEASEWKIMAQEYAPERGSRLVEIYELFLWYALRIVNGFWSLSYVVYNSSSAGNYYDAQDSSCQLEKTGARKCGGYRDGQGNTIKVVMYQDNSVFIGGHYYCYGGARPVAYIDYDYTGSYFTGVVVLTK